MRAVVIDRPGGPDVLDVRDVPIPTPRPGYVLIRVKAFGLNRSELHFRRGQATSGSFPRIPGIETSGVVEAAPGAEFAPGDQVVTLMGGMGRSIDGGYAEYVLVPAGQVIGFHSDLGWEVLGAVPEMLQTAHGSLAVGVRPAEGESLLVRGGTSSVGMALAVLGRRRGLPVLATTRSAARRRLLEDVGVDHVIVDDGRIADRVREVVPHCVDGAVELVGVTHRESAGEAHDQGAAAGSRQEEVEDDPHRQDERGRRLHRGADRGCRAVAVPAERHVGWPGGQDPAANRHDDPPDGRCGQRAHLRAAASGDGPVLGTQ